MNDTTLTKYEAAKQAIIQAESYDEVKDIRDRAVAMRAYAQQAKDTTLLHNATKIKLRAERRAGEMLRDMEKAKGTAGQGRPSLGGATMLPPKDTPPTLAEIGITKRQSSDWQRLASIPDNEFDDAIEYSENTTTAKIVQKTKSEMIKRTNEEIKNAMSAPVFTGEYDVIVIDPPWPMQKIERDVRPNQHSFDYPVMQESEIAAMCLPFAADAHIFMWTTHKFLPMALRLFDGWGVRYVLTMVWHKEGGFQPIGLPQYNCEFCLYGRIGTPKFIDTKAFPVCFNAPRGKHSEKPEEFYDVIRRVTDGYRIDIFNRRKISGFDVWGNESGDAA